MARQTRVWCYFIPKVRDCHLDTLTLAPGPEGRRVGAMRVSAWAGGSVPGGSIVLHEDTAGPLRLHPALLFSYYGGVRLVPTALQ